MLLLESSFDEVVVLAINTETEAMSKDLSEGDLAVGGFDGDSRCGDIRKQLSAFSKRENDWIFTSCRFACRNA